MTLTRLGWFLTVAACALAAVILFLSGYDGYGGLLTAVGLAAAINLR